MIDMIAFFLCFCSPAKAWLLLCLMYEKVIPKFAYPN